MNTIFPDNHTATELTDSSLRFLPEKYLMAEIPERLTIRALLPDGLLVEFDEQNVLISTAVN